MSIDIQTAFEEGLRKLHEGNRRYDEHLLHVGGDIAGLCDRVSWARRKYASTANVWDSLTGAWVNPHEDLLPTKGDIEGITAMQLGFRVEDLVLDALTAGLPWIGGDGWVFDRNVHAALILTDEGLQGRLFEGDDATGQMIEFAQRHEGVAVGHIDAVIHDAAWSQAIVIDVKSTVWSDSWKTGERVWTAKYGPKESHCLQVAAYAHCVALAKPQSAIQAVGLLELDLGGKGTRFSPVPWQDYEEQISCRMAKALKATNPANDPPEAIPNRWTFKADNTSWACGSPRKKAYCLQTTCPAHVANAETS